MSDGVRSDIDLLNVSLAGEHLGIAAYQAALGSGLLDEATARTARAFQSDHVRHAALWTEQIVARGGAPHAALGPEEYARSYPQLNAVAGIVAFAIQLEAAAARTHVRSVAISGSGPSPCWPPRSGGRGPALGVLFGATGANPVPSPIIDVEAAGVSYGMSAA